MGSATTVSLALAFLTLQIQLKCPDFFLDPFKGNQLGSSHVKSGCNSKHF